MIAVINHGKLFTSYNHGRNWLERNPAGPGDKGWWACSISGYYMIVCVSNGRIYTSANEGLTWSQRYPGGVGYDRFWQGVSASG